MDKFQSSFVGGLNQQVDSIRIADNEYAFLLNARNRFDDIRPVKLPQEVADLVIAGLKQGGIEVGSTLVLFVAGQAFYKDFNFPASVFQIVPGFALAPEASTIWAEAVSASYINSKRELPTGDGDSKTNVMLLTDINSSPQTVVCQDGVSQPQAISSNFLGRSLQKYEQWTDNDIREYVPVGRQMLYQDGILYMVGADRKSVFHSITGRPLDFMVKISEDGDKLNTEELGGAGTVAHRVDFDDITCLAHLNLENGGFYVSTARNSYAVIPDFTPSELIFGEPIFANQFLFNSGTTNNFSFSETNGDYAFISQNGIRSFNAIEFFKNEGVNSPFSKKLGPILQGIFQTTTATKVFDNYLLISAMTIYGPGIIIYDTLTDSFVGLDLYPGVGLVKQFFEVITATEKLLFFIDDTNKLYQAFSGLTASAGIYIGDWTSNDPGKDYKVEQFRLVFSNVLETGDVDVTLFVDKNSQLVLSKELKQNAIEEDLLSVPFGTSNAKKVTTLSYDFGRAKRGWRVGFYISWDIDAKLSSVSMSTTEEKTINSDSEQAREYNRLLENLR